jgi:DNA invertase Pin-like site-specific DNA recombinase
MANSLIVRRTTEPERIKRIGRAAQYVRMSTDLQRYSTQNQAAAIAAYAAQHNLTIVRTYADEGRSGLRITNRDALIDLINDVRFGRADFDHVLVYDVSRWGRFQDIDESAHYEFICKRAGIKVAYCAEQFDNDGSLMSSIVKNIKRVMAAEYSRELSAKVHAGQCRLAGLGFRQGGPTGYALRRELVDEHMQPKGLLKRGDRKYLHTDHVKLRPGASDEIAIVTWIFNQFVEERRSEAEIARQLNRRAIPNKLGQPWNRRLVGMLLKNENYVGNVVYNRRSYRLKQKGVDNPSHLWIRGLAALEPIVERSLFLRAQKIIEERRVQLPEDEMLARLRATLKRRGRLSSAIINDTVGLPCTATYMEHFGTIRNAYRLIGYTTKRDCDWIDSGQHWADAVAKLVHQVDAAIEKTGKHLRVTGAADGLLVNGTVGISFRVARWWPGKEAHHSPRWAIQRRKHLPPGWVVAIRLAESNRAVLDYLLLPTSKLAGRMIKFTEKARDGYKARRFETSDALIRSIIGHVATAGRSSAKSVLRSKPSRSRKPRSKIGRAPH